MSDVLEQFIVDTLGPELLHNKEMNESRVRVRDAVFDKAGLNAVQRAAAHRIEAKKSVDNAREVQERTLRDFDHDMAPESAEPFDPERGTADFQQLHKEREPHGALETTIDLLSRGQYVSAQMFDNLLSDPVMAMGVGMGQVLKEGFMPDNRNSFKDVLRKHAPGFAEKHPITTAVLGFIGDVALDPLTYISFGAVSGTRVFVKGGASAIKAADKATDIAKVVGEVTESGAKIGDMLREGIRRPKDLLRPRGDEVGVLSKKGKKVYQGIVSRTLKEQRDAPLYKGFNPPEGSIHKVLNKEGFEVQEQLVKGFMDQGYSKDDAYAFAEKWLTNKGSGKSPFRWFDTEGQYTTDFTEAFTAERGAMHFIERMVAEGHRDLVENGGIKFAGKYLYKRPLGAGGKWNKYAAPVLNILVKLDEKIGSNTQLLQRLFVRHKDVDPFVVDAEQTLRLSQQKAEGHIMRLWQQLVRGQDSETLERIGTAAHQVQDLGKIRGVALKEKEVQATLRKLGLNEEERYLFYDFAHAYNDIARIEKEAGLLDHLMKNYAPRIYKNLGNDTQKLPKVREWLRMGSPVFHEHELARSFRTLADARKAGYDPVMDAGLMFALRAGVTAKNLARSQWDTATKYFSDVATRRIKDIPVNTAAGAKLAMKEWDKLEHTALHVAFVGDGLYHTDKLGTRVLKKMDWVVNVFRKSATVFRPAFAGRQAFGANPIQAYLKSGIRAFDPRSMYDAVMLKAGRTNFTMSTPFGTKIEGRDVLAMAENHRVVRNVTEEGIGPGAASNIDYRGAVKMKRLLDKQQSIKKFTDKYFGGKEWVEKGLRGALLHSWRYMNLPSYVEDVNRLAVFANELRYGRSATEAAATVNKALFDYTDGLSRLETRWLRRIVPFYSYQRFAIPLITKTALHTPGRIKNINAAAETMMEVLGKMYSGDQDLTLDERSVLPGWLIDQPKSFFGFDKEFKAKFRTFNNFSPLDVFGFMRTNEADSDVDWENSLTAFTMSQLTPWLKIPIELLAKKDFFTGRALDKTRTSIGDIDLDALIANLVQGAVTHPLGAPAGGAAGLMVRAATAAAYPYRQAGPDGEGAMGSKPVFSQEMKNKFYDWAGFEQGVNADGEPTVYVSPYRLHVLTSLLPGMSETIKVSRNDKTLEEKMFTLFFGTPTVKLDLAKEKANRKKDIKRKIAESKMEIRLAKVQHRISDAQAAREDLKRWLADNSADIAFLQQTHVRGRQRSGGTPPENEQQ